MVVQPVTSEIARELGLADIRGVQVEQVAPDSAATKAGIEQGDVILALNGQAVNDTNSLRNRIAATAPGTEVTMTIFRDGREQQVAVTLGELTVSQDR